MCWPGSSSTVLTASLTGVPPGSRVLMTSMPVPASRYRRRSARRTARVDLPAPSGPSRTRNSPRIISESRGQVDEPELQAEHFPDLFAQQVHADRFGHVMAAVHGVHADLERFVENGVLRLAGKECVQAVFGSRQHVPGSPAADDAERLDLWLAAFQKHHRFTQLRFDHLRQFPAVHHVRQAAFHADGPAAELAEVLEIEHPQPACETPVVADLAVGVQRDVRGVQAQAVVEEELDPAAVRAGYRFRLSPEQSVVDYQHLCAHGNSLFECRHAAVDSNSNRGYLTRTLDLQAVE